VVADPRLRARTPAIEIAPAVSASSPDGSGSTVIVRAPTGTSSVALPSGSALPDGVPSSRSAADGGS